MDTVFSIYKGATFFLSILKDSGSDIKMESNKEVISRLKFISRINKGEKINVRNSYPFVQQNDLTTTISRTFYNKDNRGNALNFVRNTIERSFDIISAYSKSDKPVDKVLCEKMIDDLKRARNGINNLRETYATDTMFCCDIETLLESIDAKLIEIKNETQEETD